MKVCVFGLWHLGLVTAACLAKKGFDVVGLDPDETTVYNLNVTDTGLPISEPRLKEITQEMMFNRKLRFTTDIKDAVKDSDIIWVTFDTPVDDNDNADEIYVKQQIMSLYPHLNNDMTVLISSQLSVGSTRKLQEEYKRWFKNDVKFAYSPENLRLGKAIDVFNNPERIIVGTDFKNCVPSLNLLLSSISLNLMWISLESAEMTKHALNSFLATEISFINEIARICEIVGADIRDVEKGLTSDSRIGEKAYLKAGSSFAGGTLARDLQFLNNIKPMPLLSAVIESNDDHKNWAFYTIREHFNMDLRGKKIAVLGLTYKPDTNTLRRSGSIELCQLLVKYGACIKTHDPSIKEFPNEYSYLNLCSTVAEAVEGVEAIIIATEWNIYKNLDTGNLPKSIVIVDANGFIRENFIGTDVKYYSVGRGI